MRILITGVTGIARRVPAEHPRTNGYASLVSIDALRQHTDRLTWQWWKALS